MPRLGYFVTVQTHEQYTSQSFTNIAGQLCNTLQSTLGDLTTLRSLTSPTLTNAHVEVEIVQTHPGEQFAPIAARAVVKATTTGKTHFDKNMFTKLVRDSLSFPVKVTKQAVAPEDLRSA